MNCDEALPLLYDLIDEELNSVDEDLLRTHLAGCSACRTQLESIKAAELFYRREVAVTPPGNLEARLLAALLEERDALSAPQPRSPMVRAAFVGIAACFLAAAVYSASWLPESSLFATRALELISALNIQQWGESFRSLTEIHLGETLNQMIQSAVEAVSAIDTALPAIGSNSMAIILGLVALQIAGSYRLLGGPAKLTTKN